MDFQFRIPHSAIRHSKGFTLIELMVVIVVLGIMMTLVIPQLGNIGDANLKRSARHLTGMIRFLRDEAQAKKRSIGSSSISRAASTGPRNLRSFRKERQKVWRKARRNSSGCSP